MKTLKIFCLGAVACIAGFVSTGCDNGDAITRNTAFIKDAYYRKYGDLYLQAFGETQTAVPVNITRRDDTRDIVVTMDVAAAELEEFNVKYNRNYVLYPTDMWEFEDRNVTVRKGTSGSAAAITIKSMTEELSTSGNIYAIPVKITHADGIGIMEGSQTYIYVLRETPVAHVVKSGKGSRIKFKADHLGERIEFTELTIEFLMNMTDFANTDNHGLFYNNGKTESGGGQIFSRIEHGSKGIENSVLEWNIGNNVIVSAVPSSGSWETNKWYHVALVFGRGEQKVYIDGQLQGTQEVERTSIVAFTAITNSPAWDGFAWEGSSNETMLAELRLWNVVRDQEQIQENMYKVNPQTEGLLAYWKMNDGQGDTFRDYVTPQGDTGGYVAVAPVSWSLDQILSVGQ